MVIDIETYYYFVDDAGLRPLCIKLYELDKYPALRFMNIMEQIHCGDTIVKNYSGSNGINEGEYSKDIITGVFDDILTNKIKITPGKENDFHTILLQIESQKCNYVLHSEHFDTEIKKNYLSSILKAIKQRQLHSPHLLRLVMSW